MSGTRSYSSHPLSSSFSSSSEFHSSLTCDADCSCLEKEKRHSSVHKALQKVRQVANPETKHLSVCAPSPLPLGKSGKVPSTIVVERGAPQVIYVRERQGKTGGRGHDGPPGPEGKCICPEDLPARVAALEAQIAGSQATVVAASTALSSFETRLTSSQSFQSGATSTLASMTQKLSSVEEDALYAKMALKSLQAQTAAVTDALASVSSQLATTSSLANQSSSEPAPAFVARVQEPETSPAVTQKEVIKVVEPEAPVYFAEGSGSEPRPVQRFAIPSASPYSSASDIKLVRSNRLSGSPNNEKAWYLSVRNPGIYWCEYYATLQFVPCDTAAIPVPIANYVVGVTLAHGSDDPIPVSLPSENTLVISSSVSQLTCPQTTMNVQPTFANVHRGFVLDLSASGQHNISYPFVAQTLALDSAGDSADRNGPIASFASVTMRLERISGGESASLAIPSVQAKGSITDGRALSVQGEIRFQEPLSGFGRMVALDRSGQTAIVAHDTGFTLYRGLGPKEWKFIQTVEFPDGFRYSFSSGQKNAIALGLDGLVIAACVNSSDRVSGNAIVSALVYCRSSVDVPFPSLPIVLQPANTLQGNAGGCAISDGNTRIAFTSQGEPGMGGSGQLFVYALSDDSQLSNPQFVLETSPFLSPPMSCNPVGLLMEEAAIPRFLHFGSDIRFSADSDTLIVGIAGAEPRGAAALYFRTGKSWASGPCITGMTQSIVPEKRKSGAEGAFVRLSGRGDLLITADAGTAKIRCWDADGVALTNPQLLQTFGNESLAETATVVLSAMDATRDARLVAAAIGTVDTPISLSASSKDKSIHLISRYTGRYSKVGLISKPESYFGIEFGTSLSLTQDCRMLLVGCDSCAYLYLSSE